MQERPYQKLTVWKEAHQLCKLVYDCTRLFPPEEKFGLVSQMRRAAYGIPMNITEGNGRRSRKEKVRFIDIAHLWMNCITNAFLPPICCTWTKQPSNRSIARYSALGIFFPGSALP